MGDREIGLPGPQPQPAAVSPPDGETRVQLHGTVDQRDGGIDVLAQIAKHVGDPAENIRILAGGAKRLPSQIETLAAVRVRIIGPASNIETAVAKRRQRKGDAVARIARDRPPHHVERLEDPLPVLGLMIPECTQI